jgi:2-amino-4-hydroxy-6-hydroxymethyldihydropteridine diphosphokinase
MPDEGNCINKPDIYIESYMVIISLGSNVTGDGKISSQAIRSACNQLKSFSIRILDSSRFYLTEPYGVTDQPAFTNSAILVQTSLSPHNLLTVIKRIEAIAGRRKTKRWGARVIDLDIIDYNGLSLNYVKDWRSNFTNYERRLILPHPGIANRPFVLQPIMDIAPFWHHPVNRLTAAQMLKRLPRNAPGRVIGIVGD